MRSMASSTFIVHVHSGSWFQYAADKALFFNSNCIVSLKSVVVMSPLSPIPFGLSLMVIANKLEKSTLLVFSKGQRQLD